ncbi:MAG: transposase [Candidatus Lokiarchaeota archaeon]|nr:transposase [Candidatus Harpocratesius repetitus]
MIPKFTGFFNHIFEFNDLSYFDDLQDRLERHNIKFRDIFLYDIIAISLFQRFLGIESYTELERLSFFLSQHPLFGIVHDALFFPTAKDLSYILNLLPVQVIYDYFFSLVAEMIDLKIIVTRILVWDGQFMKSNANNNYKDAKHKTMKQYNDPEAGYHRHNGQHKGVGYEVSNLYCYCGSWGRAFPVYFEVFPGNKNENPMFRETLTNFLQLPIGQGWNFIILDSGGYSEESIQFCLKSGIYPLVRAKKNIKSHQTKELKKGYWFRTDFIPVGWTEKDLVQMYKIRPVIEAGQAANNFFYKSRRMNTRGLENAIRSRGLNYIFDLLRAITAVKLNRPDLISKLNSFSTNRIFMKETGWMKAAKQANFDIFYYPTLTPFQKRFWDKRKK